MLQVSRQSPAANCALTGITYLGVAAQIHILTISRLYLLLVGVPAWVCGCLQASFALPIAVICPEYYFTQLAFNFTSRIFRIA